MSRTRPTVADGLDVNEEKEGLIIYDPSSDRVHYLNSTAAVVFTLCDGERDVSEIASLVAGAFQLAKAPLGDVEACLENLQREGLLQ